MDPIRICVFGSSSGKTEESFVKASYDLGVLIAEHNCICVNGAGRFGCMGGLNEGCLSKGGQVKGIIHQKFCVDFGEHKDIKDLVISNGKDLTERKQLLMDNGDCIIVLPGGVGTFDEFWESVSGKCLGMKGMSDKPICLVNVDGFYDGFLLQMRRTEEAGILYEPAASYFHSVNDPESALKWCINEIMVIREQQQKNGDDNIDMDGHNGYNEAIMGSGSMKSERLKERTIVSLPTRDSYYTIFISAMLGFSIGYFIAWRKHYI